MVSKYAMTYRRTLRGLKTVWLNRILWRPFWKGLFVREYHANRDFSGGWTIDVVIDHMSDEKQYAHDLNGRRFPLYRRARWLDVLRLGWFVLRSKKCSTEEKQSQPA